MTEPARSRIPGTGEAMDADRQMNSAGRYSSPATKAKPPAPWFRFRVEKWFLMTRNLGPVEAVALLTIMAECHQRGEPYPEDHGRLAKRMKTTRSAMAKAIETLVEEQLVVRKDGSLWSEYIGAEIAHREERAEVASKNVKKRWQKSHRNQSSPDTNVDKSHRVEEVEEGNDPKQDHSPTDSGHRAASQKVGTDRNAPDGAPRVYQIGEMINVENEPCEIIEISPDSLRVFFKRGGASGDVPLDPRTGNALVDNVAWDGRDLEEADLDDTIPEDNDVPF